MADQPDNNRQPAYVRFKNGTCYDIEVIWINFHKKEKSYCILPSEKFLDVNTYATHPWIFRECISKSRMVVNGKEVFMARPWLEEHKRLKFSHPINVPLRTMVLIEMPVIELRQLCLLNLAKILTHEDEVKTLEIPIILQRELVQMICNKEECKMKLTN
ncbi:von Hippel-Lindau tumor suppressor homolog [Daktulosphaira vitifoliae]|uniref:von Hippel-Lindau tumor suppressor homolog n=1 Tax=Daktulosphaira vitifoliae TaxID=58002 RepID=UPI0021AA6CD1|nr:von Hippel-Lindau tumor suppressor homolog [Daktulosphaira vitifoliae]XP_050533480.1 von Hippel-Lindau tumor suppressor homolog [Daktulosphaira vitifoliae]